MPNGFEITPMPPKKKKMLQESFKNAGQKKEANDRVKKQYGNFACLFHAPPCSQLSFPVTEARMRSQSGSPESMMREFGVPQPRETRNQPDPSLL